MRRITEDSIVIFLTGDATFVIVKLFFGYASLYEFAVTQHTLSLITHADEETEYIHDFIFIDFC